MLGAIIKKSFRRADRLEYTQQQGKEEIINRSRRHYRLLYSSRANVTGVPEKRPNSMRSLQ